MVLRDAILSSELESLRTSYETLLERQRAVWRREREPGDPTGSLWDTAPQPRLADAEKFIDVATADAVELWLSEPILGTASQLIDDEVGVTGMFLMCNPTYGYGPADWHRDIHPIDLGPMQQMQNSLMESGPTSYAQWNIPLYDDVLWVIPRSHNRINTEEETRSLLEDARAPSPARRYGTQRPDFNGGCMTSSSGPAGHRVLQRRRADRPGADPLRPRASRITARISRRMRLYP